MFQLTGGFQPHRWRRICGVLHPAAASSPSLSPFACRSCAALCKRPRQEEPPPRPPVAPPAAAAPPKLPLYQIFVRMPNSKSIAVGEWLAGGGCGAGRAGRVGAIGQAVELGVLPGSAAPPPVHVIVAHLYLSPPRLTPPPPPPPTPPPPPPTTHHPTPTPTHHPPPHPPPCSPARRG